MLGTVASWRQGLHHAPLEKDNGREWRTVAPDRWAEKKEPASANPLGSLLPAHLSPGFPRSAGCPSPSYPIRIDSPDHPTTDERDHKRNTAAPGGRIQLCPFHFDRPARARYKPPVAVVDASFGGDPRPDGHQGRQPSEPFWANRSMSDPPAILDRIRREPDPLVPAPRASTTTTT